MFKYRYIHTLRWHFSSLIIVLFTACSSSSGEDGGGDGPVHQPTMLAIYVYSPEAATNWRSASTRAETGNVNPISNESTIHNIQIWIYESESKKFVGYLSTKDVTALNMSEGATYQLPVSDDFANRKPDVNVYVMANVTATNCGVNELYLNNETTYEGLMTGAKIAEGHYGLEQLVKNIQPSEGLPMAGKLTVQPVVGDAPALRVGTMSQVATVPLTRAVSKLRFVFAKTKDELAVNITGITMKAEMIPTEEYLFRTPTEQTYNSAPVGLLSKTFDDVAETTDPTQYIYFDQEAQAYEDLIREAASKQPKPEVTVEGPIYLRESDKQLSGTISYSIGGVEQKPATFQMHHAGDFLRNHTWIVYAYYAGSGRLQVQSLYVKEWVNKEIDHNFYNW